MALSSLSVVTNANRLRGWQAATLPAEGATAEHVTVEVHAHEQLKEKAMQTVKDPVCGMDINPATAAATVEHNGKTHYFCAQVCHQRFIAAPDQYAP
jgi:P-type Cu+ transporter